jgi:hypothetical protein
VSRYPFAPVRVFCGLLIAGLGAVLVLEAADVITVPLPARLVLFPLVLCACAAAGVLAFAVGHARGRRSRSVGASTPPGTAGSDGFSDPEPGQSAHTGRDATNKDA